MYGAGISVHGRCAFTHYANLRVEKGVTMIDELPPPSQDRIALENPQKTHNIEPQPFSVPIKNVIARHYPFLLFIFAVAWVANYLHFTEFGFYEDDWYFFAPAFLTPNDWLARAIDSAKQFIDGRPIHLALMYLFGYFGAVFSSIPLLYVASFGLFALSAGLMYFVLRLRFPTFFCAITILLFVLSPLTSLKQFLNGELTFGPAFIFAFVAILLYSSRRTILAYIAGALALLTYEPTFLLFLAAPLFQRSRRWRNSRANSGLHVLVCLAIIGIYAAARHILGQERQLATLSDLPVMTKIVNAVLYDLLFTVSSLKSYLYGLQVGIREFSLESGAYCACFCALILAFFVRSTAAKRTWKVFGGTRFAHVRRWWWIRNGIIGGLLFTVIGYSFSYFTLYHDWLYPLSGRDTRVSVTASFGNSIFVAAIIVVIVGACRRPFARLGIRAAVAAGFAALFLYAFAVQGDYEREWSHERSFLTQLMMLSPDVNRDTLFIVKAPWLSDVLFPGPARRPSIGFQRHGLQVSVKSIFGWNSSPNIFVVYSDEWKKYLQLRADKLYWTQTVFPGGWARSTTEPITPGHIVVMDESHDGSLSRVEAPVSVGHVPISQVLQPFTGTPQSNWAELNPSPLLSKVVFPFVSSSVMVNEVQRPFRSVSTDRIVNLAVKFPPVGAPFQSGKSEPLVVSGKPGGGDIIAVHYYGQDTLRLRIYHWGFPHAESEVLQYDPNRIYFVSVTIGEKITAAIAGGVTAIYPKRPYPSSSAEMTLGRNPIGGGVTTETFSGQIVTSDIIN